MVKIAYSETYRYTLPPNHRFPMEKYDTLAEQLLYEGTVVVENFFTPPLLEEDLLLLTHSETYWNKLSQLSLSPKEIRKIGFPLTPQLITRGRIIASGTLHCALHALDQGVSLNIAGGTHHSFKDHGEGFCVFNDVAIASNYLLEKKGFTRILIVDLDVHQGNGNASIFQNDPRVFTFSMHGEKNYPLRKEQSDLDIGLADHTDDKTYLKILKDTLPRLLDWVQPEIIFYISGVDVLATDKLGRLGMTLSGCKERDRFVVQMAKQNGVPIAISMGGGYSTRLADIVEAHANTFRVAQELFF
jgi:acetoin utilization deacetylase AcuC-like enzyme